MGAAALPRVGAALVALAVGVCGCEGCRSSSPAEPAEEAAGETPDEPSRAASRRVGVKVPMPPGWIAQVASEGSFQFGPPGHPVLRVDLRSGQGGASPSAEVLSQLLARSFVHFERSGEQRKEAADVVLVQVQLTPRLTDGGTGTAYPALFGARRVEKELFLCATFPGITSDEVLQAAEACAGIEITASRPGP